MKKISVLLVLVLFLFSCGDDKNESQYEYHCREGVTDTTLVFENHYGLNKVELDSILDDLIYSGKQILNIPSTFELRSLRVELDTIKDTTFLTLGGLKNYKDLKLLNTSLHFYGKNLLGGGCMLSYRSMLSYHNTILIHDGEMINMKMINVSLDIEEEIRDKVEYSFQDKSKLHTIDSTITIRWNTLNINSDDYMNNMTMIRNSASIYGNKKRSLSISKNNIKKAINLLETKNGDFSITNDVSDKNGFSLVCGSEVTNQYFYYDDYITLECIDKEDLIKKLKFILEYVYTDNLKYDTWVVSETKGKVTERYNK